MGVFLYEINWRRRPPKRRRGGAAMLNRMRTSGLALAIGGALVLAGCAKTIDQRGNLPADDKLAEIQTGVATRDDVIRLLGTPSSTGTFDDKTWYYISKRTEQFAFLQPELLDQQVVAIAFDENGTVRDLKRLGMADKRD